MKRKISIGVGLAALCVTILMGTAPRVEFGDPTEFRGESVLLGTLPTLLFDGSNNRAQCRL